MPIRIIVLLGILIVPQLVTASWTGIGAFVGQHQSDWSLSGSTRNADSRIYGLQIEERTRIGLRIGARAYQNDLTLENPQDLTQLEKYNAQNLTFYLRWPIALSQVFTLHNLFSYEFNLGTRSGEDKDTDIDWIETMFSMGLSARLGHVSIRPFVQFRSLNGDITSATSTRKITLIESRSYGALLDIYVEPTAYVRLEATTSGSESLMLSFVREY